MKGKLIITIGLLLSLGFLYAQDADKLLGKWTNEDKSQIVEVVKKNKLYIGKLIYVDEENSKLMLDTENEDETLRNRRLIGAEVWTSFEYLEDKDMWKYGEIYNYKTGNSYTGKIQIDQNQLKLTGFYGFFFFLAKTHIWTRVSK